MSCSRVLIRITAQLHGANRLEALKSYVKVRIFEFVASYLRVLHWHAYGQQKHTHHFFFTLVSLFSLSVEL